MSVYPSGGNESNERIPSGGGGRMEIQIPKNARWIIDTLEDAGYGVNRTLKLLHGNTTMYVRTSTGNEVSHIVMPVNDTVQLSAWFAYDSYDDKWQINLRDTSDFKIIGKQK